MFTEALLRILSIMLRIPRLLLLNAQPEWPGVHLQYSAQTG